jgi:hypothetical protein
MTYLLKALDLLRDAYVTRDWEGVKKAKDVLDKEYYKDIHTCSYYCIRPACIAAQRDELREKYVDK